MEGRECLVGVRRECLVDETQTYAEPTLGSFKWCSMWLLTSHKPYILKNMFIYYYTASSNTFLWEIGIAAWIIITGNMTVLPSQWVMLWFWIYIFNVSQLITKEILIMLSFS